MHAIDWAIVVGFTAWIVYDGLKRTKDSHELEGYFLAKRSIPWWAAGISVMATQLSAITMIGTTGQAYADGMRFIQFYFALPLAMIILSVTLVPFFYHARVYTAYEYLEKRFDPKIRSLTSLLFLISRGLSVGAVVSAPAVVMSLVLGWNLALTALAITMPAVVYTMFGGVQAVTWTDVKTTALIVGGLLVMIVVALLGLPDGVSVTDGFAVAANAGRLRTFDFSFDLTNQYTFWSGTIAALFLFCSYFGADQSQVQRYLTAKSLDDARQSLLMSAYWKIPLQIVVLLVGVLVFVFYTFNPGPMIFNAAAQEQVKASPNAAAYGALQSEYDAAYESRRLAAVEFTGARQSGDAGRLTDAQTSLRARDAALQDVRKRATQLVRETKGDRAFTDVNYVIPTFILTQLPIGLIGLLIVGVLMAATDTIAAELNSLSTATVIDFYKRWWRPTATDAHYLVVSKALTGVWGLLVCGVAVWAVELGSLIEVVNRFGSFFYGSILGVFVLAMIRWATSAGALVGLAAGIGSVAWAANYTNVAFLWHNVIGVVAVVVVGLLVSAIDPKRRAPAA
ncbi:MAG TPA: sodium:solute symporter [Vicinamibacterales bacterium]|nr:sodium:solute symporter [Vicinamibacterales bacterium]